MLQNGIAGVKPLPPTAEDSWLPCPAFDKLMP
jgi:hypothetical protein